MSFGTILRPALRAARLSVLVILGLMVPGTGSAQSSLPAREVVEALDNIRNLERTDQDGYATFWDGDKYIQCHILEDDSLSCEAAGALMQTSLGRVLTPDRTRRLASLGWRLDPSFGNYVQSFALTLSIDQVVDKILTALTQAYKADLTHLEVETFWVAHEDCPPRNGPSQNLAGMVNDAPAMASTALHACAYSPAPILTAEAIAALYQTRVMREIQRLRINSARRVYLILQTSIGYIQCEPESNTRSIYCEAQSEDSWPALAQILSPDRVAHLHKAGFEDPGRAQNYSKEYAADRYSDATIAHEILLLLHDAYGYDGTPALEIKTEQSD